MIAALIRLCIAHRSLVLILAAALVGSGIWAARHIAVDAIPDLSDVQVIIRTDFPGQSPEVVEDQVTYPLTTAMLAVPRTQTVRGFSMSGDSFVYVIFADGTDPYWARARVLEQLSTLAGRLPEGVTPRLGPDASGVGWVYQYVLDAGPWSPDHPRGLWHDPQEDRWYAERDQAPVAQRLVLHRHFQRPERRWVDTERGESWPDPSLARPARRPHLVELTSLRGVQADPLTGTALIEPDVDLDELRALQDWWLRYELNAVSGVSEIATVGGFERSYRIEVDPLALQARGLALKDLARAVRAANRDRGGRVLERGETELLVRARGLLGDIAPDRLAALRAESPLALARARRAQVIADLEAVTLGLDDSGAPLLLGEVARVVAGPEQRRGIGEWNGQGEAVGGIVVMRQGENARDTIARTRARIEQLRAALPPGVDIVTAYDRSDLIDRAVATLTRTLIEEITVVSLVTLLFLLHARSALVAVIVLPTGVLTSLLAMHLLGINANIMSLGGIAVAIGVMVDSAIIMVENAHRRLERRRHEGAGGRSVEEDLSTAAAEVGPTLFFSLLIITVSFLPIFVLTGQSGRLFTPLAWTKVFAMSSAAILSVTLIPVLATVLIREHVLSPAWPRRLRLGLLLGLLLGPALLLALLPLPSLEPWRWWLVGGWLLLAGILLPAQGFLDEERHPLTRLLRASYDPVFAFSLANPWKIIFAALMLVALTILPWSRLGSEFMPPLEEGDFLYMPQTDPGLSVGKAFELLQQTDALIAAFPEVKTVFGKAGRADSATDPAPLIMLETTIQLHRDRARWRQMPTERFFGLWRGTRPITLDELTDGYELPGGRRVQGINDVLRLPGLSGALTRGAMPIRTRIDMLATGIRTPLGLKLQGPDLELLQELAERAEALLRENPALAARTASISSENIWGGRYLDLVPDRAVVARHGLAVGALIDQASALIGGEMLTMTLEGRERYAVQIRAAAELRERPDLLRELPIALPDGRQVPLGLLVELRERFGPAMVLSEDARPLARLFITPVDSDLGGWVAQAERVLAAELQLPAGYSWAWSGAFEHIQEANARLAVAVPLTFLAIVLLLYLATNSWTKVALVVGALPFSILGAIWLVFLLDYQLSLAVIVGMIALAGLDAETSLVMLHYQDASLAEARARGRLRHRVDLWWAIRDGAVQRIRPKIMTVLTTGAGLMPMMLSDGVGADTMRRLAAPMIGGLVTTTLMELAVIPAVYYLIHRRGLPELDHKSSEFPVVS